MFTHMGSPGDHGVASTGLELLSIGILADFLSEESMSNLEIA